MRRLDGALLCVLAALACAGSASARALPSHPQLAFEKTELVLRMDDGVPVAATLYRPASDTPPGGWPAIVMFHGLGGNRGGMNALAERYFVPDGYAVLTFDARGHGDSGGLFSGTDARGIADFRALVAWLAARADVEDDAIGAWGISLGGGAVWRSLVEGVPFTAAAVVETWTDLYEALVPQNLSKSGAVFGFLNSVPVERTAPAINAIREDAVRSRNLAALRRFSAERSVRPHLGRVRTPVLLLQGRRDFAFGLEQAITPFRVLAGPKRLYIGPFGHAPSSFPGPDVEQAFSETQAWFDRFLKGERNGIETRQPVVLAPDPYRAGAAASFPSLPPTRTVALRAPGRSRLAANTSIVRTLAHRTPTLLETFGTPVLHVTATGTYPHLVAVVKASTPDGREIVVSEGGAAVRLSARPRTVTIRLISQATTIPRGSRLTLRLGPTSGDLLYIQGVPAGSRITIGDATLRVPVLRTPVSR